MSIPIQSEQKSFTPANKRATWRMINTAIILLAFVSPWFRSCGDAPPPPVGTRVEDTVNGFQVIQGTAIFMDAIASGLISSALAIVPLIGFVIAFFILISIPVYSVLNLFVALSNTQLINKPIWIKLETGLLGIGAIGLSIFLLNSLGAFYKLLWGYWFTWVGLGSSIWLERINYLSRRSELTVNQNARL